MLKRLTMDIHYKRLHTLLSAYIDEKISYEEMNELIAYIKYAENNEQLIKVIDEIWSTYDTNKSRIIPNEHLYKSILSDPRMKISHHGRSINKHKLLNGMWLTGIAAMLCIAASLLILPNIYKNKRPVAFDNMVKHILPGSKKATLTLSDGKIIALNDVAKGQIAKVGFIDITKKNDGQIVYSADIDHQGLSKGNAGLNKISTPKGGEFQVVLPDGTNVWLNAASTLTFPTSFDGEKRVVSLDEGEAYFEVVPGNPFVVHTSKQIIDVLGTKFNICSYAEDSDVSTSLIEGKVRITIEGKDSRLLHPGEKSILQAGTNSLLVKSFSKDDELAWKNGFFTFYKTNLKSVMRTLSRWYDVEVFYKDNVNDIFFGGTISRFGSIEQLLNTISLTGTVKFKIEGRNVIVMR